MAQPVILASGSAIRADMLRRAGVDFSIERPRIDEVAVKATMQAEGAAPRDIADALAEAKARKVAMRHPQALVIGSDQVLDFRGDLMSKPETPQQAVAQLARMRGKRHMLLSASVVYDCGRPVWRHVGQVRMLMREVSDSYLADYVDRNWHSIRDAVGAYKLEEEGVRLFARIDGDYFTVLGMPLLELLNYLTLRGILAK